MRATIATLAFGKSWEPFILNREAFQRIFGSSWLAAAFFSCSSPHVQIRIFISTISNIRASSLAVHSRTKQALLGHGAQHGSTPFSHFFQFFPWVFSQTALRIVTLASRSLCNAQVTTVTVTTATTLTMTTFTATTTVTTLPAGLPTTMFRAELWGITLQRLLDTAYFWIMFTYVCIGLHMFACWSVPWLPCQGSQYGFCQNHNCPSCRETVMNLMALRQCLEMLRVYSKYYFVCSWRQSPWHYLTRQR